MKIFFKVLLSLLFSLPMIATPTSCKKKQFLFAKEDYIVMKAIRDQKLKETGDLFEAKRAYKKAYDKKCRQKNEAVQTDKHSRNHHDTSHNLPMIPTSITNNVSYFSDGDLRYVSNLTEAELHHKTQALLHAMNKPRSDYAIVARSILEENILNLAPKEKLLNQKICNEILLPECLQNKVPVHDRSSINYMLTDNEPPFVCWKDNNFNKNEIAFCWNNSLQD